MSDWRRISGIFEVGITDIHTVGRTDRRTDGQTKRSVESQTGCALMPINAALIGTPFGLLMNVFGLKKQS